MRNDIQRPHIHLTRRCICSILLMDHGRPAERTKTESEVLYTSVSGIKRAESESRSRKSNSLFDTRRRTPTEGSLLIDEVSIISNSARTSEALEQCRKTMLKPYLNLLKVVGWRRFRAQKHDLDQPLRIKVLNIVYPIIFLAVILASNVVQWLTCFARNQATSTTEYLNASNLTIIKCSSQILAQQVIPVVLNATAYLWGIYLFRLTDPEYLSTLMETVFLSCSEGSKWNQKGLKRSLQAFLVLCFAWILFTVCANIVRIFSLRLLDPNIRIEYIMDYNTAESSPSLLRYVLVIASVFGYTIVDLVYIAVLINYVSQCQLIIAFIRSIAEAVRSKSLLLVGAPKMFFRVQEFLDTLNGHIANMQSLCLVIFGGGLFFSAKYIVYHSYDSYEDNGLIVVAGVLNVLQWMIVGVLPLIQAARLTRQCTKLRSLGLEIAARPYIYSDVSQESLDTFLQFTSSTHYTANIFCFPFYTKYIILSIVVFGFVVSVLRFPISWL